MAPTILPAPLPLCVCLLLCPGRQAACGAHRWEPLGHHEVCGGETHLQKAWGGPSHARGELATGTITEFYSEDLFNFLCLGGFGPWGQGLCWGLMEKSGANFIFYLNEFIINHQVFKPKLPFVYCFMFIIYCYMENHWFYLRTNTNNMECTLQYP
jgi:hypothetical protein